MIEKQENKKLYLICDSCGNKWTTTIYNYKRKKSLKDLCSSCSKKGSNNPFYGKHHSQEIKQKISETQKDSRWASGSNNPFYGKHHSQETKQKISETHKETISKLSIEERKNKFDSKWWINIINKTNREYYGEIKSKEMLQNQIKNQKIYWNDSLRNDINIIKQKISQTQKDSGWASGSNNPMSLESIAKRKMCSIQDARKFTPMFNKKLSKESRYKLSLSKFGSIPPINSGNGISGWIIKPKFYFRSSYELSYFIYLINNKIEFQSCENSKYKIYYIYKNKQKIYYPDIIINNTIYEIKPKKRLNEEQNLIKTDAAKKWCLEHHLNYEIITEENIPHILSKKEILEMNGIIIQLNERWRKKLYEQMENIKT